MKARLFFFTFLAFLLLFSACKKDPYKYEVSGTVTEFGTNEPIEGAEVYLLDCVTDGSATACDTAEILITDAAGRYRTPFLSAAGRFPIISAFVPDYFPSSEHFVTENRNSEIDFVLDPFAWLNVRVVNDIPAGEADRLKLGYEYGSGELSGWIENLGSNVDKTYFARTKGNRDGYLLWRTYENSVLLEEFEDNINIPAHDTLYYEIRY